MDDDDKTIILCNRVSDSPVPGIDNCTKEKCLKCSAEVWISPATKRIQEEKKADIVCGPCAAPEFLEAVNRSPWFGDDRHKVEITPSQIEEINAQIRRDVLKN